MSPTPLVSIVTPVYNQAEYLAATMRSVLEQDYPALEFIVIDDGSSDASLAVAEQIAAEYPGRVSVLTQANAGQAVTLNRGWGLARGDVLAYLSSDDCLCPGAVTAMVKALQAHPGAPVAYCDFWLIDAAGRRLREVHAEDFSAERMIGDLVCQPGPGAFFRRCVFDQAGGWNPTLRQVPDFEYWLRSLDHGDFVRLPRSLAEYRIHEGSASFRVMQRGRAEEIIGVMDAYWRVHSAHLNLRSRSMARAFSIAAKNHAQSGRVLAALRCFAKALSLRPALVFELSVWRQLLAGFLRRLYYQFKSQRVK